MIDRIEGDNTSWEAAPLEALYRDARCLRFIAIPASGSRWTRCATKCISKIYGNQVMRLGAYGRDALEQSLFAAGARRHEFEPHGEVLCSVRNAI